MGYNNRNNPDFSWSSSRARMFEECALCYGLHYYGAHNGWFGSSTPLAQAAYRLKVTRSTEGRLMDSITTQIYNHHYKEELSADEFRQSVRSDLNLAFSASKNHKEDWYKKPKHVPMLTEMIREDRLNPELVKSVLEKMDTIIDNFYQTMTKDELDDKKTKYMEVSRFPKFTLERLNDLTVFAGIHLLYQRSDGKLVAVNYKTTTEKSNIDQLGTIALYLLHLYGKDGFTLEDIVIRDEFLLTGESENYYLDEDDIDMMYDVIEDSVNMMAEHVMDGDLTRNEAISLKEFARNLNHIGVCESKSCSYCQLVELDLEEQPNGVKSYSMA